MDNIDYGPLAGLIGTWKGDKGQDLSPLPDGEERNSYYETIVYQPAGEIDNAETQELVSVHYRQRVNRISDDKLIHDQTGYWIWDADAQTLMHSFTIPRGVSVIAGGKHSAEIDEAGNLLLRVAAGTDPDWQIVQSGFMRDNALTTEFTQTLALGDKRLSYSQSTSVEIYNKRFVHTDQNELSRQ